MGKRIWTVDDDTNLATWEEPDGGSVPGTVLPNASPDGATLDSTTYDNTVTGSGKLTTLVVPIETPVLAVAVEGDAFPRIVISSEPDDDGAIFLGDGTYDPVADGASIGTVSGGGLYLNGASGVRAGGVTLEGGAISHVNTLTAQALVLTNLPVSDPHVVGALYQPGGTGDLQISLGE